MKRQSERLHFSQKLPTEILTSYVNLVLRKQSNTVKTRTRTSARTAVKLFLLLGSSTRKIESNQLEPHFETSATVSESLDGTKAAVACHTVVRAPKSKSPGGAFSDHLPQPRDFWRVSQLRIFLLIIYNTAAATTAVYVHTVWFVYPSVCYMSNGVTSIISCIYTWYEILITEITYIPPVIQSTEAYSVPSTTMPRRVLQTLGRVFRAEFLQTQGGTTGTPIEKWWCWRDIVEKVFHRRICRRLCALLPLSRKSASKIVQEGVCYTRVPEVPCIQQHQNMSRRRRGYRILARMHVQGFQICTWNWFQGCVL